MSCILLLISLCVLRVHSGPQAGAERQRRSLFEKSQSPLLGLPLPLFGNMGGIFSMISKLIWGDAEAQRQPQLDVDDDHEPVTEMEQLVAQVSDLKHGEYVESLKEA